MRKLRLELDDLQVESFETAEARAARGTVEANEEYTYVGCLTAPQCRTPGHASCDVTRCDEEGCSDPQQTPQCPPSAICP